MSQIDPKRTGVKARLVCVFYSDGSAPNGIGAEPGDCQRTEENRLMFACPGCGQWGGVHAFPPPKKPEGWEIVSGHLGDVTRLTLSPSIHCISCCGWHGYLTAGVFVSC